MSHVLVIDIGGTKTNVSLVTKDNNEIIQEIKYKKY